MINMENLREYIDAKFEEVILESYRNYKLDLEKINSIEDCKKILEFLCKVILTPLPKDVSYSGFEEVEQYFK